MTEALLGGGGGGGDDRNLEGAPKQTNNFPLLVSWGKVSRRKNGECFMLLAPGAQIASYGSGVWGHKENPSNPSGGRIIS